MNQNDTGAPAEERRPFTEPTLVIEAMNAPGVTVATRAFLKSLHDLRLPPLVIQVLGERMSVLNLELLRAALNTDWHAVDKLMDEQLPPPPGSGEAT